MIIRIILGDLIDYILLLLLLHNELLINIRIRPRFLFTAFIYILLLCYNQIFFCLREMNKLLL